MFLGENMITWYQIVRMDLNGRDIRIGDTRRMIRGPLISISTLGNVLSLRFAWIAISDNGGEWRFQPIYEYRYDLRPPRTNPNLGPDQTIHFVVPGFGKAVILPLGDHLDPSEVPGLKTILEITEEVPEPPE